MSISRREFLGTAAVAATAQAANGAGLPTRVLGKTKARVSILAFGGGSRILMYKEEDEALAALKKALDMGITYIDSSDDYGKNHLSEQRVGMAIKGRRDGLFLATKVSVRGGDEAARRVDESLKALQLDHVDLIHIHQLSSAEDLAAIEAKGGVLERLQKIRDQKMTRFIGITSHTDPNVLKTALERHDFDCTQMALNAATLAMKSGGSRGMIPNEAMAASFETTALPVAVHKQMGVIAMKVFAQDHIQGDVSPEKLLHYSLSLPVATAVVGMPKLEYIDANVRAAKAFKPLPKSEMKQLSETLSAKNKVALEHFFRSHVDG
jgi:aryl-alcohol dehydrogenase-like predicted oxidoreductase